MDKDKLVNTYKKIIEPNLKDWIVFEHGTCVIIYKSQGDLKNEAAEVLKKYGSITPGTKSADFTVMNVGQGWIVTGEQPGILNYVSEEEGRDMEDYEIGLIGRDQKKLDAKELKIAYVNNPA